MELFISSLFGLESLIREDLEAVGYPSDRITVRDGSVLLSVPEPDVPAAIARTNLWVRRGERVLLCVGNFDAGSFDELYEGVNSICWEEYIPESFAFHVDGYSRKSKLFAIPACQGICKKAVVKRLLRAKGRPETGRVYEDETLGIVKIMFGIVADRVRVMIDTSGDGLHKRGYRPIAGLAPLRETLAAGMTTLSRFHPYEKEALVDPFCGSGTIVIEAAMIAHKIAPGLNRAFRAERWPFVGKIPFERAREEARDLRISEPLGEPCFFGSDIDSESVEIASMNARNAGVSAFVRFKTEDAFRQTTDALSLWTGIDRQLIITNPPYGHRMRTEEETKSLFERTAKLYLDENGFCRDGIRLSVISPVGEFEAAAGRPADKRRKLYNGEILCEMSHYFRRATDR
ncbi:MAG: class I SAM-dependent RNA methyltransferase [Clostridiaceae bacterium]|nr:class I SAM-dependent RNA methyltransferase [Clostridiaceae bacterium]